MVILVERLWRWKKFYVVDSSLRREEEQRNRVKQRQKQQIKSLSFNPDGEEEEDEEEEEEEVKIEFKKPEKPKVWNTTVHFASFL